MSACALLTATNATAADVNGSCTLTTAAYQTTSPGGSSASQTQSFDGTKFEVVGAGTFMLVSSSKLQVQVTLAPYTDDGKHFGVSAVALKFGSTVYVYEASASGAKPALRSATATGVTVAAQTGDVAYSLTMSDGSAVQIGLSTFLFPNKAQVLNVTVVEPPSAARLVAGLCGNFDKNKANDNVSRTGQAVPFTAVINKNLPNAANFAKAWAVAPAENLFSAR